MLRRSSGDIICPGGGGAFFGFFVLLDMGWVFFVVLAGLAFPCFVIGLLALPLCGAAPTFFAAAKKVGKEDS
ncbi:hypothetical protein F6X40_38785 [Paraburkholderia sp. UCT31]|nr:hypothetical protein [Paraburkholderia sp. UCT31]